MPAFHCLRCLLPWRGPSLSWGWRTTQCIRLRLNRSSSHSPEPSCHLVKWNPSLCLVTSAHVFHESTVTGSVYLRVDLTGQIIVQNCDCPALWELLLIDSWASVDWSRIILCYLRLVNVVRQFCGRFLLTDDLWCAVWFHDKGVSVSMMGVVLY